MTLRVIQGGLGEEPSGLLVEHAAELVTMAGGLRRGSAQDDPAAMSAAAARADGRRRSLALAADEAGLGADEADEADEAGLAVACWEGRILAVGRSADVRRVLDGAGLPLDRFQRLDAAGGTVTPGLVDPHTHLVFGGSREAEARLRRQGAGYLEILAAGGGILSTVAATRAASDEALLAHGRRWLAEMLRHGATTVEAKSGYGLDVSTELRLLAIAGQLDEEGPVSVVPTFLGAHAVPPEYRDRPDGTEGFVRSVIEEQLPAVAAQGWARFCDVFCEEGVFSAEQSRRILEAGRRHGLAPRLHADELAPSGGAELAAELGAVSADHLAVPSEAGVEALAAAASGSRPVVATLLPATTWTLRSEHRAPARRLIEAGVPVALATDFNPGTSPTPNLALVLTIATLELGLSPAEALAGVTINAAHALGLGDSIGSLEQGKAADLVLWRAPSYEQLPYWAGADLVATVIKRGRPVFLGSAIGEG
ncbi:MAG TPA: imidazolonepropionase [Candidatus Limnocylindrales bacterium]